MAYLKITSLEDQILGWKERQITSSVIMQTSVRMVGTHHLMMITIIPGTSSMIKGMTGNARHQGNGQLFIESKVVYDKIKKHYLVLALSFRLFRNMAYRL